MGSLLENLGVPHYWWSEGNPSVSNRLSTEYVSLYSITRNSLIFFFFQWYSLQGCPVLESFREDGGVRTQRFMDISMVEYQCRVSEWVSKYNDFVCQTRLLTVLMREKTNGGRDVGLFDY